MAGKLLKIAVSLFQVQTGVSYSIMDNVKASLPQLESKWLSALQTFLASIDAHLVIDHPGLPKLQRLHNFNLMDVILSSQKFKPTEIRRLNYCRLYLKAVTVSDLTDIGGDRLDLAKRERKFSFLSSITSGVAIHQERPSDQEWKLWAKANALWSQKSGYLLQPLGDWVLDIHSHHQRHFSYLSSCGHLWVRVTNDQYLQCNLVRVPYNYRETEFLKGWDQLPSKSIPMLAIQHQVGMWKGIQTSSIIDSRPVPTAATFHQYIHTLSAWELELLDHVELELDPYTVCEALSHGIRAVSDGSDWDQIQGSFGWAMSNDIGERCAFGMGPARSAAPHAYRSESYGLLSMLCFLHRLAEFTG